MTNRQRRQSPWQAMRHHFPYRQFILGAIIPSLIFYVYRRFEQPVMGAFLAGGWGLGVVLIGYLRSRKFHVFAGLATTLAVVELLTTAATRSPTWYLASAAIESTLIGVIFLGSLLSTRPILQRLAEESVGKERFSEDLRKSAGYQAAWRILTAVWGAVYVGKAVLLLLLQGHLPLEAFLIVRTLVGWPVLALLFTLSFWFPRWYWNRARSRNK